jgi:hypothetical protein
VFLNHGWTRIDSDFGAQGRKSPPALPANCSPSGGVLETSFLCWCRFLSFSLSSDLLVLEKELASDLLDLIVSGR